MPTRRNFLTHVIKAAPLVLLAPGALLRPATQRETALLLADEQSEPKKLFRGYDTNELGSFSHLTSSLGVSSFAFANNSLYGGLRYTTYQNRVLSNLDVVLYDATSYVLWDDERGVGMAAHAPNTQLLPLGNGRIVKLWSDGEHDDTDAINLLMKSDTQLPVGTYRVSGTVNVTRGHRVHDSAFLLEKNHGCLNQELGSLVENTTFVRPIPQHHAYYLSRPDGAHLRSMTFLNERDVLA